MATKRFDPRKLMELAVDVMVKSRQEPRGDGKASPLVGAILWNDGTVDTASRSELRDGDHAEFTLLERKHRSSKLDEAVMFSTLEPCAPGARKHPKLSCAERIVLARIKEIWVGVEDPDPTVDRKGIKYLQDSGVKVHLFDRDLQERIRKVNREFIVQAKERAAAARDGGGLLPALSEFEASPRGSEVGDLEHRAIEAFRAAVGKKGVRDRKGLYRWLAKQGLLVERKNSFVPTGFGIILFGKQPRTLLPQAALLGSVQFEDGREELRDFDGPAIDAPEQAIQWLKDKLPNPITRTSVKRKEILAPFYEILREGIVNALVHRDYAIKGAKCQLIASRSKVVVMSPGAPVAPVTMQQLEKFDAPMLSRNPVLHHVFSALDLAEERGIGLRSMRARAMAAELPLPVYSYKAPYVVLTMFPDAASATANLIDNKALAGLSEAERVGWAWLVTRESVTSAEYQEAMGLAERTARLHLRRFTDLGLVRAAGAARSRRYEVVRP